MLALFDDFDFVLPLHLCALRFDGGKLCMELEPKKPIYIGLMTNCLEPFEATLQMHQDDKYNFGTMFLIQRSVRDDSEALDEVKIKRRIHISLLYLHLYDKPVPEGYRGRDASSALSSEYQSYASFPSYRLEEVASRVRQALIQHYYI